MGSYLKFERRICGQVLDISRYMYAVEASDDLPTATQLMAANKDAGVVEIREQIQENLDFIKVTMKYMVFERDALKRELKEARSKNGMGGQ